MKQTVDNLKDRPKEDRAAVAGTIAATVMVVIFLTWGYFFVKRISSGEPVQPGWEGKTDLVDFSELEKATRQFNETYYNAQEELKQIRDSAAQQEVRVTPQTSSSDVFIDTALDDSNEPAGFGIEE